jgi:HK97 gp10 family phage protein
MANVSGSKELKNRLESIQKTATNEVEQALLNGALYVERDAKIAAPVDTGRLRSSITHDAKDFGSENPYVEVGTNVEYAQAVEYGTSRAPAQPFLMPAHEQNKQKILKLIAQAIKNGSGM